MAGDDNVPYENTRLRGIERYFNNSTIKGRANVAMATFAGFGLYLIYRLLRKDKQVQISESPTQKNV